jgi:hypothetical protein
MHADTPAREPRNVRSNRAISRLQRQYRRLAAQLAEIGFIATGTVVRRSTRCGTPGCRCHADPPQLHGPYYQWTTKVAGKTVTRRLTEREAELYQEWIANNRQLRQLVTQMRQISARAAELISASDTQAAD